MKKTGMRVTGFLLAILMMLTLMPYGSFLSYAKEGGEDNAQTEEAETLGASYKVGDIIKFGHYEQDGNLENGKEEIEWQVLDVQSNRVLVISKYILDNKDYNNAWDDSIWETCDLRAWLNDDFYNTAFDETEKEKIAETTIESTDVEHLTFNKTGTPVSKSTVDKIFCLSLEEVERYFGDYQLHQIGKWHTLGYNYNLICSPTEYVKNHVRTDDWNNCFTITEDVYYNFNWIDKDIDDYYSEEYYHFSDIYPTSVIGICCMSWWLRSPTDSYGSYSSYVKTMGETGWLNSITDDDVGVRPALYINTTNNDPVDPKPIYPKLIEYQANDTLYATTFDPAILADSSYKDYNDNLAQVCAILSQAIYRDNGSDEDKKIFQQMGIDGYKTVYDPDFVYSIAYDSMMINEEDTNVIFFVCRGTHDWREIIKDAVSNSTKCAVGPNELYIYNYSIGFVNKVMESYEELLNANPELKQKPTKIVVTGHSLGGAAANYLGALLTEKASKSSNYNRKDVFVYTFGAIDSMDMHKSNQKGTFSVGYQNIHNIYNFHDTFGPNGDGVYFLTTVGNSGYGKFGHIDIFASIFVSKDPGDYTDHDMIKSYFPPVFECWVNHNKEWQIVSMHCPVDINVYQNGKLVSSVVNNVVDESVTTVPTEVIGDEKYFLVEKNSNFRFDISATAEGQMTYEVIDAETGNEGKDFQAVTLTPDKKMVSYIAPETEMQDIQLFVEDESGKIVTEVKEDGSEIPATVQSIFKDVKDGAWYVSSVQYVYDKDIMTGKGDQIFAPNTNLKREEFTQMLYKNEGKPAITITDNPFTDVKNAWYKDSVLWAKEKGIVSGKSATLFGIGKNITREELALMLYKYAQYKNFDVSVKDSTDLSTFTDTGKVSSWAVNAIKWAVERGIISGKGNATNGYRIDPQKGATRAECAAMMKKFAEVYDGAELAILEAEEEPIALPMEETEEGPLPEDETEDIIDDEEEQEEPEEIIDEEEKEDPEEEKEEIKEDQEAEEFEENSEEEM